MMRARFAVLATILLSTVSTFANITGTVMNHDAAPIAGAKVSVFALETPDARRVRFLSKTPDRVALATMDGAMKLAAQEMKVPVLPE